MPLRQTPFPHLPEAALAVMKLLSVPIYIYDFGSEHIGWANDAALVFWNAETAEELLARELTPYSDSTRLRLAHYQAAFRTREVVTESWTLYPKGVPTPTLSRCRGVSLDGCPEAMLVEIQVLSPAELPRAELHAIEALRHTPLMISMFSESGEVLMRNPAAQGPFARLDAAAGPSADLFRAMFADQRDCELLLEEAAVSDQPVIRTATMAITGWPVHAIQLALVNDPISGGRARLIAQQDTSQLTAVTRQLAASEAALDSVLSLNFGPALVISAHDNRVLKANFAAQALLGSFLAKHARAERFFADPAQYAALRGAILEGGAGTVQLRLKAANRTTFWASISGARITYDKQDALVVLVTDIDQLYQATAELEAALDTERRTTQMQQRFLAMAAHELRTPLAIIDNTAQLLERNAANASPDQARTRAIRIRATVQRMLHLLETTIENTRMSMGLLTYTPQSGPIGEAISSVAIAFRETHAGLDITVDLPDLPEISFDRHLIEQALSNLLANAIKYADGPPRIELRAIASSEDVQIYVRDHGIGIPPDEREAIFSENARASNVGERPGTGLGLSIVRQIAGLHGGFVEVVDTLGKGATIRLTLPRP